MSTNDKNVPVFGDNNRRILLGMRGDDGVRREFANELPLRPAIPPGISKATGPRERKARHTGETRTII